MFTILFWIVVSLIAIWVVVIAGVFGLLFGFIAWEWLKHERSPMDMRFRVYDRGRRSPARYTVVMLDRKGADNIYEAIEMTGSYGRHIPTPLSQELGKVIRFAKLPKAYQEILADRGYV